MSSKQLNKFESTKVIKMLAWFGLLLFCLSFYMFLQETVVQNILNSSSDEYHFSFPIFFPVDLKPTSEHSNIDFYYFYLFWSSILILVYTLVLFLIQAFNKKEINFKIPFIAGYYCFVCLTSTYFVFDLYYTINVVIENLKGNPLGVVGTVFVLLDLVIQLCFFIPITIFILLFLKSMYKSKKHCVNVSVDEPIKGNDLKIISDIKFPMYYFIPLVGVLLCIIKVFKTNSKLSTKGNVVFRNKRIFKVFSSYFILFTILAIVWLYVICSSIVIGFCIGGAHMPLVISIVILSLDVFINLFFIIISFFTPFYCKSKYEGVSVALQQNHVGVSVEV